MILFRYHEEIIRRFPNLVGGLIVVRGLKNLPTPEPLQRAFLDEQARVAARVGDRSLAEIPALGAWRSVFRAFGVDGTRYRNAAEALTRRLAKGETIPSINTLVDIGNLVSIRYALPLAVFDTRHLQGAVTVRFADGSERYTPLKGATVENPEPGEVIHTDEAGLVITRRWCWRQSEASAATLESTDVIVTVEAHHGTGQQDIRAAVDDLTRLIAEYAGGQLGSKILDASLPVYEDDSPVS